MPDELANLANIYLDMDTPEYYLDFYRDSKDVFDNLANKYYKKFVLSLPTLEERWQAYLDTPAEWLKNANFTSDFDDDIEVEVEGETVKLGVIRHLYESYGYSRYETWDAETLIERFSELEYNIEHNHPDTIEYYSRQEGKHTVTVITQDMIDQWKQKMIEQRLGGITMDW